jgi:hypothetical protein
MEDEKPPATVEVGHVPPPRVVQRQAIVLPAAGVCLDHREPPRVTPMQFADDAPGCDLRKLLFMPDPGSRWARARPGWK